MDCGYGYTKAADGSCKQQQWVRGIIYVTQRNGINNRSFGIVHHPGMLPATTSVSFSGRCRLNAVLI